MLLWDSIKMLTVSDSMRHIYSSANSTMLASYIMLDRCIAVGYKLKITIHCLDRFPIQIR